MGSNFGIENPSAGDVDRHPLAPPIKGGGLTEGLVEVVPKPDSSLRSSKVSRDSERDGEESPHRAGDIGIAGVRGEDELEDCDSVLDEEVHPPSLSRPASLSLSTSSPASVASSSVTLKAMDDAYGSIEALSLIQQLDTEGEIFSGWWAGKLDSSSIFSASV